eukprot:TRINITY_DN4723_c0_g1_i1.p1 TRINITY_DN4723_c0_g1~~TRINITY_DN4723_c0_g1_i1.p1  ORF type:complete len:198 (-),score=43.56 TRINITY_DN4723_c0_g1_i1:43-636(-)
MRSTAVLLFLLSCCVLSCVAQYAALTLFSDGQCGTPSSTEYYLIGACFENSTFLYSNDTATLTFQIYPDNECSQTPEQPGIDIPTGECEAEGASSVSAEVVSSDAIQSGLYTTVVWAGKGASECDLSTATVVHQAYEICQNISDVTTFSEYVSCDTGSPVQYSCPDSDDCENCTSYEIPELKCISASSYYVSLYCSL